MQTQASTVEALGEELGEAIANTPEYEAFEEATAAVENSEAAQEKIAEFERVREEFLLARQSSTATKDDLKRVQETQEELHAMAVMEDFLEAKAELTARLEAINETISDPLEIDFGGEAGGCCQE